MPRYSAAPRFLRDLLQLKRNTRRKRSELVVLQKRKLRAIVRHAYENVRFYHRLLKSRDIQPRDIESFDDLSKLPLVTKKEVQENIDDMISSRVDLSKCVRMKTSGSTGVPLTILKERDDLNFQHAVSLRQSLECGERLRDKVIQIRWTGSASAQERAYNPQRPFYEKLGFLRNEWILADRVSLESIVNFMSVYKPDVIVSYPAILQLLAGRLRNTIHPRLVFSTAEILGRQTRALIEGSFDTNVIDSYGCVEAGDIAWECPETHDGYHMNIDSVVVEVVKDEETVAAGEEGEIVVTNLFNYAMPFIRYKLGDVGSLRCGECSCGRTLPLMHGLSGRSNDFIVLPDGRRLPPWFFWNMIDYAGVSGFRIVQERIDLIRIWLRAPKVYDKNQVERTMAGLRSVFGEGVSTMIEIVDEIPRDNTGKLRNVTSDVSS